jgi:hypothetical protein
MMPCMIKKLEDILRRVGSWPEAAQSELAEIVEEIEGELSGTARATSDELRAIDEADASGLATEDEVETAFRTFRRA